MHPLVPAFVGVALGIGATAWAQPAEKPPQPGITIPRPPREPERTPAAVKQAFDSYKSAILNDKGADAAECVDRQTLDWYEDTRRWALTATRAQLAELSLFNRLQAVLVRHRVARAELEKMDGRKLFVHAVENGWVGKSSVSGLEIGEVSITGAFAAGTVVKEGRPTNLKFQFVIEAGRWRLKLLPVMKQAEPALRAQIKRAGLTEDGYILQVAETVSGRKPAPTIWDPPE